MAHDPLTVQKFENDLINKISNKAKKETEMLQELKREHEHNKSAVFEVWDQMYYEHIAQKRLNKGMSKMKEYFPAEHIKNATLDIYQELLSLDFKLLPDAATWNAAVSCYEVRDQKSKDLLGHFYLDLYPRENKFNHAAAFPLIKRARGADGTIIPAAAAMLTNFSPPEDDKPSLMAHSEVKTFFHEFGHLMHNLCSEANYTKFSGTAVERDFVEMPSQMLENWIWDPKMLKRISKHYKTGQPLSDEAIKNVTASKNFLGATFMLRQLFTGSIDFLLYSASSHKLLQQPGNSIIENLRSQIRFKSEFVPDTDDLYKKAMM